MPTPQLPTSNPDASLTEIKDYLVGLTRYLNYLLSSLDTLNISRLDAKVIVANTVTAAKMNVTQLSAITADMGTLTAGTIIGATIKTANTGARIELNANALSTYNASNQAQGINWGNIFGLNYGDVGFFDASVQTLLIKNAGSGTGWQISADSGATMYLGSASTITWCLGNWNMAGTFKVNAGTAFNTITQADSTATTVAGIVADFNTLLANLRVINVLV